jgi:hypothetical protein
MIFKERRKYSRLKGKVLDRALCGKLALEEDIDPFCKIENRMNVLLSSKKVQSATREKLIHGAPKFDLPKI